jgi:hypothetical protein
MKFPRKGVAKPEADKAALIESAPRPRKTTALLSDC